jgi:hypothetical protein
MDKSESNAAKKIKDDAKGAKAPSQADSKNDGADSAEPFGDRDATRKPDDHSAPTKPATGDKPKAR